MVFITRTVYIDVLLCVNLIINYFILLAVAKYTKIVPKQFRIIFGSIFGAICSLIIFLPEIHFIINLLIKILIAAIIVLITFGLHNKKSFLKNIGVFFFISFCFCGVMIALWFVFTPKGMVIHNSVVYFNISPIIMIVSSVICYFVLRLVSRLSGRETPALEICKIKIINNGTFAEFYGKVDTGNTLTEPFSHAPVIVVDRETALSVSPTQIKDYMMATVTKNQEEPDALTMKNIRFIPFNSIGGEGILPAFIPEEIYINNELYTNNLYVALCNDGRLNGSCKAMINPQIINS